MLDLLNDLLDSAKPEAGKFEIYKENTDLKKIIEERLNFYKLTAEKTKIKLETQFDPSLPNGIFCDSQRIGLKWFLHKNEESIFRLSDCVIVAVTDTAMGMSQENIKQLFNKFKQFVSTVKQAQHKGIGLGLAISKGIIESHGGIIAVASEEGVGSTFYFTLPIISSL